jgi:surfeit locus 1 family protein
MANDMPVVAAQARARARRRPAWIPTIAAFATVAACILAGNWQHRRMLEKEALLAQVTAMAKAVPVALPADIPDWRAWRFRVVTLTGEFDARHQVLVDNRVHDGRVGFGVVAPFTLADGRSVLVDRGFIAGGASRAVLPSVAVPSGTLTLRGRIDLPSTHYLELGGAAPSAGPLWQHVDPQRFAQATGIDVLPIMVREIGVASADGLLHDDALPDTGIEKHIGYMLQWYTFAALAAGLWLWFTARPWLRGRLSG